MSTWNDAQFERVLEDIAEKRRAEVARITDGYSTDVLRADNARLRAAIEAFLSVATFPSWSGGDCRCCAWSWRTSEHAPGCEYAAAEQALRDAVENNANT